MSRATPIRSIAPADPDDPALLEAAAILRDGGLVAFPTETVYGLGADATNPDAVARIFEAKGRPPTNPLIVHADGHAMASRAVREFNDDALALADAFWPGPLTLVLPRSDLIPDIVAAGGPTVGVRVPTHPAALSLIRHVGRPLAAPSANRSNRISSTTASHVADDLDGRIDLILDAGPCPVGLESTVLDLSGADPRILRPGPIGLDQIASVLGRPVGMPTDAPDDVGPSRSPGRQAVHYAPRIPAFRIGPREPIPDRAIEAVATLVIGSHPHLIGITGRHRIDLRDPIEAARGLYDALHRLDASGAARIIVAMPPDTLEWAAVRDRLLRATRPCEDDHPS